MATEPEHKNPPNSDPTMPGSREPAQPTRGPVEGPALDPELDPDRGYEPHQAGIEDGRGTVSDRNRDSEIEHAGVAAGDAEHELDPAALAADRAMARTSDRDDGRDGVDASDTVPIDPDGVGGKQPKPKRPSRS